MKKIIISLFVLSCIIGCQKIYTFGFTNNSDKDIWLIVDLYPEDKVITPGSYAMFFDAHSGPYPVRRKDEPYEAVAKDSIHLYILDRGALHNNIDMEDEEKVSAIDEDYFLALITIPIELMIALEQDSGWLFGENTLTYPPTDDYSVSYYVYH